VGSKDNEQMVHGEATYDVQRFVNRSKTTPTNLLHFVEYPNIRSRPCAVTGSCRGGGLNERGDHIDCTRCYLHCCGYRVAVRSLYMDTLGMLQCRYTMTFLHGECQRQEQV
jgi:hypothetical protein